jgi:hypothetical protein
MTRSLYNSHVRRETPGARHVNRIFSAPFARPLRMERSDRPWKRHLPFSAGGSTLATYKYINAARGGPCLFTATIVSDGSGRTLHAFLAAIEWGEDAMRARVGMRLGSEAARQADIRVGFDPSHPLVMGMVSDALAEILSFAHQDPKSPLADGLEIVVEQRFS